MRRGGRKAGQALVEFALIAPILILLVLGTVDGSFLASDKLLMVTAARHGSRLAAQLGGIGNGTNACQGTLVGTTLQSTIDSEIVQNVVAVAQNANFAGIDRVDIYKPGVAADGSLASGDLVDTWQPTGPGGTWVAQASQTYTLAKRCQGQLGSEVPIGVKVTWHYVGANKIISNITGITEYADELMTLKDPSLP